MWLNYVFYNLLVGFLVFNGDVLYINDLFFDIIKIILYLENVIFLVYENRYGV